MLDIPFLLIAVVVIALIFDFTNGAHDSANAIATIVSTKVLSPQVAVVMAASLNLGGAFLGTAVAHTIGSGIVSPEMVAGSQGLVLSALFGAIVWNLLTWYLGLPSSSSHALIGGLIGAAIAYGGFDAPNYPSIAEKILLPLVLSPLAGFLCGYLLMVSLSWMLIRAHPTKVNHAFKKLQIVSSAFMATSHGLNDAQKTMGIITLALFTFHQIPEMAVPLWVKLSCALAMGLGTATGGWKIVKTMGHKIFKLEPIHGFAAETAAALVITGASAFGAPISTTHTISTAVIGVGASKRLSAVRWGVAGNLVMAWVLTIPAAAVMGAICFEVLSLLGLS
ncbi:inorganic phosphate transporter [Desulfovibrio sulfodismutans]|uniref:Inorganic phosphate transporter n=1 Tax=Desulfolutivibrio sulfodismutans TaxID=63561 RepID=A0A7K3NMK8_9BACT|nr:inorganic phosphate transporter [Desulfolutivibrio sulfodismutans]NDY56439.1 inorganic phosphate transporter [Desulfolutivibrio sulfodismutans]QLA13801.1 inorganic phosphate transporter [Desulfolutivibrio sulfodismutans DSM 3696]